MISVRANPTASCPYNIVAPVCLPQTEDAPEHKKWDPYRCFVWMNLPGLQKSFRNVPHQASVPDLTEALV